MVSYRAASGIQRKVDKLHDLVKGFIQDFYWRSGNEAREEGECSEWGDCRVFPQNAPNFAMLGRFFHTMYIHRNHLSEAIFHVIMEGQNTPVVTLPSL